MLLVEDIVLTCCLARCSASATAAGELVLRNATSTRRLRRGDIAWITDAPATWRSAATLEVVLRDGGRHRIHATLTLRGDDPRQERQAAALIAWLCADGRPLERWQRVLLGSAAARDTR